MVIYDIVTNERQKHVIAGTKSLAIYHSVTGKTGSSGCVGAVAAAAGEGGGWSGPVVS